MQPVSSSSPGFHKTSGDSQPLVTETKENPKSHELSAEEKEIAQAKNEMFAAGVTNGGVLPVNPLLTTEQQINQCTKEILDSVLQSLGKIQGSQLEKVTEEQKATVASYVQKAPQEEAALYCHMSSMMIEQLRGFLIILDPSVRPLFVVCVQEHLQKCMPEAVAKFKKISPEFLVNVQIAMCKPKLDAHIKELENVDKTHLQDFRDTLEKKLVGETTTTNEQVINAYKFIQSVPAVAKDAIIHCFIKAIDLMLKKE